MRIPGELALRAGRGLQRHARETRQLRSGACSSRHASSSVPCETSSGASGCAAAKPGRPRHLLVDARVVLHRAGAERIEALVDREVQPREAREVARDLDLRDLRLPRDLRAAERLGDRDDLGHVERRQRVADLPLARALEDERLVARLGTERGRRGRRRRPSLRPRRSRSLSASAATSRSISSRVFISVDRDEESALGSARRSARAARRRGSRAAPAARAAAPRPRAPRRRTR